MPAFWGGSIVSRVSRPEGGTHLRQHRRGGQGSLRECVLSFHRVCPRDYNELIRFGGLYLPPHWQGGLLKRRGSFHLPRFPGGGDDFRMTSACRFHLIRKPKNASGGSGIQRRLTQRGLYPKPTANLFGNSDLASLPPFSWGGVAVVLTIDVLREASVSPVPPALVPFFQAPGRSLIASPMGWYGAEKRETFEVEVSCTNGIITPGNHLQSNYGLLLACSSFFSPLLKQ